jgi:hypothetical protein
VIIWLIWALVLLLSAANAVLHLLAGGRSWTAEFGFPGAGIAVGLVFASVGALVASRQRRNAVGCSSLPASHGRWPPLPSNTRSGRCASEGDLSFEVEDDGTGFDADRAKNGSGLTNMADRLDALGGTVDIESAPGRGTVLRGRVPVAVGVR